MILWLFFVIFGLVLFVPSSLLIFFFNRFKNTIVLLIKQNGSLRKIIINNKDLEAGKVTKDGNKTILPITITKEEIIYGKWRRWIIKAELENKHTSISDKEAEDYLNNEDLLKLYLAGKFKDTLILLMGIIIGAVLISGVINGYLTTSNICLDYSNETRDFMINSFNTALSSVNSLPMVR